MRVPSKRHKDATIAAASEATNSAKNIERKMYAKEDACPGDGDASEESHCRQPNAPSRSKLKAMPANTVA
jgi:hypothetical protein